MCIVLTGLISVAQKRLSVELIAVTRVLKAHSTEHLQFMTRPKLIININNKVDINN